LQELHGEHCRVIDTLHTQRRILGQLINDYSVTDTPLGKPTIELFPRWANVFQEMPRIATSLQGLFCKYLQNIIILRVSPSPEISNIRLFATTLREMFDKAIIASQLYLEQQPIQLYLRQQSIPSTQPTAPTLMPTPMPIEVSAENKATLSQQPTTTECQSNLLKLVDIYLTAEKWLNAEFTTITSLAANTHPACNKLLLNNEYDQLLQLRCMHSVGIPWVSSRVDSLRYLICEYNSPVINNLLGKTKEELFHQYCEAYNQDIPQAVEFFQELLTKYLKNHLILKYLRIDYISNVESFTTNLLMRFNEAIQQSQSDLKQSV